MNIQELVLDYLHQTLNCDVLVNHQTGIVRVWPPAGGEWSFTLPQREKEERKCPA